MFMQFAKIAVSFSLLAAASDVAPAWSANKQHDQANCPLAKKKQEQARRSLALVTPRGAMLIEQRKRDVQILSFGP